MNNKKCAFTIASLNYMNFAINLRNSFLKYNNDYDFIIILADLVKEKEICNVLLKLLNDGIDIRSFLELKNYIDNYPIEEMIERYDILELDTALKPFAFEYFFKLNYEKIIYLDPDIQFYNSIIKADELLDSWDIILTPHMMAPYPEDGRIQNCEIILRAGMNNCGFVAFRKSSESYNALKFWQSKLKDKCYNDVANGYFTDQRWTDFFPYIFNNVYILKDYGYNAAYWNLHERKILEREGIWYSNDNMLVFFHFSGLDLDNINLISKYQNRYTLNGRNDDLKKLVEGYVESLSQYKYYDFSSLKFYFSYIANTDCDIANIRKPRSYNSENPYIFNKEMAEYEMTRCGLDPKEYHFTPSFGINIIGYIDGKHSIGGVARDFARRIASLSIPFSIFNVDSGEEKLEDFRQFNCFITDTPCYPVNLIVINADALPNVIKEYPNIFTGKYNILNLHWEFESGFEKYSGIDEKINEIVVFSDHIKNAISKHIRHIKISKIPYPLNIDTNNLLPPDYIKEKYFIDKSKFSFFFNFDYNSYFERKNPIAVLESFCHAFEHNSNVILVLKTSNEKSNEDKKIMLLDKIKELGIEDRVAVIDSFVSKNEMLSLINSCDAYISLHRAEGFDLGLLEAMYLGKPVIASNYSGNLEFMNHKNSFLVDTKMVPSHGLDIDQYSNVTEFGDPDISMAAHYMKLLYEDDNPRKDIGINACNSTRKQFGNYCFKQHIYKLLNNIPNDKIHYISQKIPDIYAPRQIKPASLSYTGDYSLDKDNNAILPPGITQFGPYQFLKAGTYQVTVYGEGLGGCSFDVAADSGETVFKIYNVKKHDGKVTYMVDIPKDNGRVEFRTYNVTNHDVVLKRIEWQRARKNGGTRLRICRRK